MLTIISLELVCDWWKIFSNFQKKTPPPVQLLSAAIKYFVQWNEGRMNELTVALVSIVFYLMEYLARYSN